MVGHNPTDDREPEAAAVAACEEQPFSYHELRATMLHLLGLDHTRLTYRFNGRDVRLTDVYGTLIPQVGYIVGRLLGFAS